MAAVHVLILVASRDLGGALIFFVTYLVMLYVATRKLFYFAGGLLVGCIAAVAAYGLFSHVRVRVVAWRDPLSVIDERGVSDLSVAVCNRNRRLVWNGTVSGVAE